MWFYEKLLDFMGCRPLINAIETHNFNLQYLQSRDGLQSVVAPIFPALLFIELLFFFILKRNSISELFNVYKIPVMSFFVSAFLLSYITFNFFMVIGDFFLKYSPVQVEYKWYWFIYAYVAWEFSHYIFHFSCHKVRLLWCMHSPHHAPTHMNLSVIFTAFFLHGVYAAVVRTSICAALGVPLPMLLFVMILDACWGSLIHVSEEAMPKGKLWFLHRFILTPAHHRVHHAKNPEYIDKNYCNALNVWDRLFGTYQEEMDGVRPIYGVAREINERSFFDMYFGEFACLIKDLRRTPALTDKIKLIFMPPGWKPC